MLAPVSLHLKKKTKLSIGAGMSDWTLHGVTSFAKQKYVKTLKQEKMCEIWEEKFFVCDKVTYHRSLLQVLTSLSEDTDWNVGFVDAMVCLSSI